jgi:Flp pilus assembly protein TadD
MLKRSKMGAFLGVVACSGAILTTGIRAEAADLAAESTGWRMTAVLDRAQGRALVAGDYQRVIERLRARDENFEATTNLCVAYAMSGDLARADAECARALMLSESAAAPRDRALALTNLGVLSAAHGDLGAARSNFSRALELDHGLRPASDNLQRLDAVTLQ